MPKSIVFLSDIHANFEALKQIQHLPEYNDPDVMFWFGGDYSDGFDLKPDATINTWNFIKSMCDNNRAVAIMGNHDEFIVDAVYRPDKYTWWEHNGRANTLENLGLSFVSPSDLREQLLYHYHEQMEWLRSLPLYLQYDNVIMVHAGFDLDVALNKQHNQTVLWIRDPYLHAGLYLQPEDVHYDFQGKTIVSGHTPTSLISNNVAYESCPIVKKTNMGLTRYFIDGGSKSGSTSGHINLLKLSTDGTEIWRKYATEHGIFNAP